MGRIYKALARICYHRALNLPPFMDVKFKLRDSLEFRAFSSYENSPWEKSARFELVPSVERPLGNSN